MCSAKCAVKDAEQKSIAKAVRQAKLEKKIGKEKLLSLQGWDLKMKEVMQEIARLLDADKPCIASGKITGKMAGGHYYAGGSGPFTFLKHNIWNIHKQSFASNSMKAGDTHLYRLGLIERYGLERLEWIEGLRLKYKDLSWSKDDLINIYLPRAKEVRERLKKVEEMTRDEINDFIGLYK